MNKKITFSIPFSKVDEEQRTVTGIATAEVLDKQGEIVDYEASKKAFSEWSGNIREMHGDKAVGKKIDVQFDDVNKAVILTSYVSKSADGENAWTKIKEGVLTGYSIGGSVYEIEQETAKSADGSDVNARRIKSYGLAETSFVDSPACPVAEFLMVKNVGGKLEQTEKMIERPKPQTVLGWQKVFTVGIEQYRELQKAQAGVKEMPQIEKAEKLEKKDYTDKEREAMAESGEALPDGSFPIKNKSDLENAIKAYGRAKDKDAAKAHIKKRAKALGLESELPDDWDTKAIEATDLKKADTVEGEESDKKDEQQESAPDSKPSAPESPQGAQDVSGDEGKDVGQPEGAPHGEPSQPQDQRPSEGAPIEGEKPAEPAKPEEPAAPEKPAEPEAPAAPEEGEKAARGSDLRKDLYTVGSLADCLSCLVSIRDWCVMEAEWEGDGSSVPADLTAAIENLGGILTAMTQEEVAEAAGNKDGDTEVVLLADKTTDMEKITATIETATQTAVDRAAELIFGKVGEVIKPLADRVAQLEHQPAAASRPVATYHEVEKGVGMPEAPNAARDANSADMERWTELKATATARKNDPTFTVGERQALVDEMWKLNKKINGVTTADLNPLLPATHPYAFRRLS